MHAMKRKEWPSNWVMDKKSKICILFYIKTFLTITSIFGALPLNHYLKHVQTKTKLNLRQDTGAKKYFGQNHNSFLCT